MTSQMGARPMARVIQQTIKTPLADEVLFGRLKNGGTVRVVVTTDEDGVKKLGFVFPEGPVLPRPDKEIVEAGKKRVRSEPEVRRAKARKLKSDDDEGGPEDEGGPDEPEGEDVADETTATEETEKPAGIVPNVPLQG